MTELPRKVEEAAKEADRLWKEVYGGQNPPPAAPPPANPPANTPPATPGAPPTPEATTHEPVVAPAPVTAGPPAVQPPATPVDDYRHKYEVLQGKYNAEVPRYAYELAVAQNRITELERQIAERPQTAAPAAPAPSSGSPTPPTGNIGEFLRNSQDEKIKSLREHFPDLFDGIVSAIDQVASVIRTDSEKKWQESEEAKKRTAQAAFIEALDKAHPDWKTLAQSNPNWTVWLNEPDRYTGRSRLELLKAASERLDAKPIINMIDDFKKAFPAVPPPSPQPVVQPSTPPAPATPGREQFVTPPATPSAGQPPAQPQAETITRQFVNDFYNAVAKGHYRGREKERLEIEARINRANTEGRIV